MSVTFEQVRTALLADEPDYARLALLGPDALPHLEQLIAGNDPGLASKAASLAGRIPHERSADALLQAAKHANPVVRVAAAESARHLPAASASKVLIPLLADPDIGVRKLAIRAVPAQPTTELKAHIERLKAQEAVPALKQALERLAGR